MDGRCFCHNVTFNTTEAYCDSYCAGEILYKPVQIILQVLYVIVLLVGLLGNLLTCVVIIMRKSMRRSIHIYTFNLAACDLLLLIFVVPAQMMFIGNHSNWVMGVSACRMYKMIQPTILAATVFTLLAITVDRARALLQPFKYKGDSRRRAKISLPIIWVVSIVICLPRPIYSAVLKRPFDGLDLELCIEDWPNTTIENAYFISGFVLLLVVPSIVIFIIHVVIVVAIRTDKNSIHREQNRRMIKLTIAVVTVFVICSGISHLYYLLKTFGNFEIFKDYKSVILTLSISNFIISVQAALYPIIYGTVRQDFNKGFKGLGYKLLQLLKLSNDNTLCIRRNPTEHQTVNDKTKPINRFDHYFDARNKSSNGKFGFSATDPEIFNMVKETKNMATKTNQLTDTETCNMLNETTHQNNGNILQTQVSEQEKNYLSNCPDSPLALRQFCMFSADVLLGTLKMSNDDNDDKRKSHVVKCLQFNSKNNR